MTFKRKTRFSMPGMLLIALMSAIFMFPPGVHLELCFGGDGHFDMAMDACLSDAVPQQHAAVERVRHHHDDCLDIVIGCGPSTQLLRLLEDNDIPTAKSQRERLQPPDSLVRNFFPPSIIARSTSDRCHHRRVPPAQLAAIRTVVLLI